MSLDSLHIIHGEISAGTLVYDRKRDRIELQYEDSWQFGSESFPMSLSLPLSRKGHPDERIRPFLQGLLPDNPAVIEAWGKRYQVSPRNPFDVIKHVGEDCAGALQFVQHERLGLILSGALDALTPLSEEGLARRMADLQAQARAVPVAFDGRFCLSGAQLKDALYLRDGRWFVPAGRIPSTHILKPQLEELEEHALNEHFCLELASMIGLSRAESSLMEIAGKPVLSVTRYDRIANGPGDGMARIHQEDACQALGRYPHQKYQSDGGPSAAEIVGLLDRFSDDGPDDVVRFITALALNWVIAGTDGHAKNFSLLHWKGSNLRMAPLYDLASFLPYQKDSKSTKIKVAMKIGGSYRLHQIDGSRWRAWANEAGLSPAVVVEVVRSTIKLVSETLDSTRSMVAKTNDHPFLNTLAEAIAEHARICAKAMD